MVSDERDREKELAACFAAHGNFIPNPKITFRYQCASSLTCGICLESKLTFKSQSLRLEGKELDDTVPAILPCGHVFGQVCLRQWLRSNSNTCPVCRMEMKYPFCAHPILPRPITRETIFSLPMPLPGKPGSRLPDQCNECRITTQVATDEKALRFLVSLFVDASRQYQKNPSDDGAFERAFRLKDAIEDSGPTQGEW